MADNRLDGELDNSLDTSHTPDMYFRKNGFGIGWSSPIDQRVEPDSDADQYFAPRIRLPDGRQVRFGANLLSTGGLVGYSALTGESLALRRKSLS